jgi:hypothetical protein
VFFVLFLVMSGGDYGQEKGGAAKREKKAVV